MSLLTNCALLGIPNNGTTIASWTIDGTVLGSITMPTNVPGIKGALAANITDDRIYVSAVTSTLSDNHIVYVYDGDGVLVNTITPGRPIRCLHVPEAGKVWVAIEETTNGIVNEYDEDGAFLGTVATLSYVGDGYIEVGYGMHRVGDFLYYLSLRGAGFEANSGVFKHDFANGNDPSILVYSRIPDREGSQVRRFAQCPNGDIYIHVFEDDLSAGSYVINDVRQISSAGIMIGETHFPGALGGLAVDQDGAALWVGDIVNDLIYRRNLTPTVAGTYTSFTAMVDGVSCSSVLTTPFGQTPAEDEELTTSCPLVSAGVLGIPFTSQINTVGGNPPYTYVVTGGALPPGLTLDPITGVISGVPTVLGEFDFTISVTDTA